MESQRNGADDNPVLAIGKASGAKQPEFTGRPGIGLQCLKRHDLENTLPGKLAVMRTLYSPDKKHGVEIEEAAEAR